MQATQSSTASESGIYSGKFAALRHVTREMSSFGDDAYGALPVAQADVVHSDCWGC